VRLQYHGREVQDGDRFVLAITSYRYAGGDGYDMFRGCELIDADPTPIAEHIVRYLREHGE
jgi:2',3'-cyclic-nucleotide 2'-phosphodiesterase/3'-nucleotidase